MWVVQNRAVHVPAARRLTTLLGGLRHHIAGHQSERLRVVGLV